MLWEWQIICKIPHIELIFDLDKEEEFFLRKYPHRIISSRKDYEQQWRQQEKVHSKYQIKDQEQIEGVEK